MKCRPSARRLSVTLAHVRRAAATRPHTPFAGLAPAYATPCIKATASSRSVHRNISPGAMQPLPEGGGSGGGPPTTTEQPPSNDGGSDRRTSKLMGEIFAQVPALITALVMHVVECMFAIFTVIDHDKNAESYGTGFLT